MGRKGQRLIAGNKCGTSYEKAQIQGGVGRVGEYCKSPI